jgi:ferredoxin
MLAFGNLRVGLRPYRVCARTNSSSRGRLLPEASYNRAMSTHTIVLQPSGFACEAGEDTSILHAFEAAGIELPNSCRNGTCRTCICRVRSGEAAHRIEWPGLSFDEKREGYILACVAVARSDLVIEAPVARRIVWGD